MGTADSAPVEETEITPESEKGTPEPSEPIYN